MTVDLTLTVNGKDRRLSTEPDRTLLEVIREDLGLTGTKYGCGEGACRACTVLLDGQPVQSCRTPVGAVGGRKIETIESLSAEGELHSVQKAFIEAEAMQCGYCVPGMVLSTVGLLRQNASPSRKQIVEALNGNLCRCCGYENIVAAVQLAAKGFK